MMQAKLKQTKRELTWTVRGSIESVEGEYNMMPNEGDTVLVGGRENTIRSAGEFIAWLPDIDEGWPGNSNPGITRFHGWRGTTNDVAMYGYGVRTLERVDYTEYRNGNAKLVAVFGPDQKAEED